MPTRKRDQLSLNSDHTHFVIIREQPIALSALGRQTSTVEKGERQLEKLTDSAESATNKFRDRFENFLHQETLQQPPGEPMGIGKRKRTIDAKDRTNVLHQMLWQLIPSYLERVIHGVKMVFPWFVH